jgi:hypothetical protein
LKSAIDISLVLFVATLFFAAEISISSLSTWFVELPNLLLMETDPHPSCNPYLPRTASLTAQLTFKQPFAAVFAFRAALASRNLTT